MSEYRRRLQDEEMMRMMRGGKGMPPQQGMQQGMPGAGLIPQQQMPQQQGPAMPAQQQGPAMPAQQAEFEPRAMSAVRTGEEEAAYNLGAKMGAQALAAQAGATQREDRQAGGVNEDRLIEAEKLLMEYKRGKASVDRRIINAQDWWKLRNWQQIENERGTKGSTAIKSATGWLWNCVVGKHAEAMDAFPEPVILPRMEEDKPEAQMLSDILPVVLSMNGFEDEYSKSMWQKFQEGTGAYHVGWDKTKLGGIGDISVKNVNLLNLYWEPGVEDLQESANLFYVQIVDSKQLEQQYPQLEGRLKNAYLKPNEYRKDDSVSVDGKSVLVDWYYHTWNGPKKVLHYCQFVNHIVLYSTENNGEQNGLYDDGEYPFVLDPLYPVHGSPAGYGLIDICRDAQTDIDTLNQAMVQNAVVTSTPRYFIQTDGQINEDEFADWSKPFVHTGGGLGDQSLRQIMTTGIQGNALQMLERKIDELKFVSGNTDVQNGGTPAGVTAASAIAALQEQSGRGSKDSSRSSYRAANKIYTMVIERIRQFYEIPRWFRILGQNGQERFELYNNARLQDQRIEGGMGTPDGFRRPVFDIDVRSQRETAYTKLSQNELMIQMYQLGAFAPQNTDAILQMMEGMDFRGKDEMMNRIRQQGTLMDALMQVGQIAMALSQKYDPAVAQQLAPVLQGIGMDAGAAGIAEEPAKLAGQQDAITGKSSKEAANVRKARENVQNAIRPA
ncbi:MAG: hypothetical protein K6F61_05050 [Clostridiales bacterium]|nr:hypothetical protein [Clostridiales bacterium]